MASWVVVQAVIMVAVLSWRAIAGCRPMPAVYLALWQIWLIANDALWGRNDADADALALGGVRISDWSNPPVVVCDLHQRL